MIRFDQWLAPLMVHRDEITPDPMNDNNGDVDALMESLEVNGCYRPIYAHPVTKRITGGHTLYAALLELGAVYVPVGWGDPVDDETARRRLVTDNQIARLARPDTPLTVQLLNTIKDTPLGLRGTGFTEDDYFKMVERATRSSDSSWLPRISDPIDIHQITCPECGHRWSR